MYSENKERLFFGTPLTEEEIASTAFFAGIEAEEQMQADGYDFTDPNDNPYILSGEDLARAEAPAHADR